MKQWSAFTYICNTQGDEAGGEYIASLTYEQRQGLKEYTLAKRRGQQTQVVGNIMGAAANAFNQNAQQAKQQAQSRERYIIKDQYGMPKGSIERSNY